MTTDTSDKGLESLLHAIHSLGAAQRSMGTSTEGSFDEIAPEADT